MAEQCADSKILTVIMKCDVCKLGNMVVNPNSYMIATNLPQYEHICDKCGAKAYYPNVYPTQIAIPIEPYRDFNEEEKKALGIQSTSILT